VALEPNVVNRWDKQIFDFWVKVKVTNPDVLVKYNIEPNMAENFSGELEDAYRYMMSGSSEVSTHKLDFTNKISGSVVENPHVYKRYAGTVLQPPTNAGYVENVQAWYDAIKTLNGITQLYQNTTNLFYASNLFSFNIIEALQRIYGDFVWKGATTLPDKITRANELITKFVPTVYGYGSSPTGNKYLLRSWNGSAWNPSLGTTHTNGTITPLTHNLNTSYLMSDGIVHVLVNSEVSNGTVASAINTDYVELTISVDLLKIYK
jgi:hypothetical protein